MSKSNEIKPTDGRKGNKRKKSIPKTPVPDIERSNKPALNHAKKSRRKQYALKAIKNVYGNEGAFFESLVENSKDNYNFAKLVVDMAYGEEKEVNTSKVQAPTINFFGDSAEGKKIKEKIIDITPKDE